MINDNNWHDRQFVVCLKPVYLLFPPYMSLHYTLPLPLDILSWSCCVDRQIDGQIDTFFISMKNLHFKSFIHSQQYCRMQNPWTGYTLIPILHSLVSDTELCPAAMIYRTGRQRRDVWKRPLRLATEIWMNWLFSIMQNLPLLSGHTRALQNASPVPATRSNR